jgi:hypothetical protein
MEKKITAWVAGDKSNKISLYLYKPRRNSKGWWYLETDKCKEIDNKLYPQVKWEDAEPTEVELTIKIKE